MSDERLLHLLHHGLGYGKKRTPGWRNYIYLFPQSDGFDLCREAEKRGLLTSRPSDRDGVYFHATKAGEALAAETWLGPKMRAFRVESEAYEAFNVIAAPTAGKARMEQVRSMQETFSDSTRDLLMDLRVTRAPEFDAGALGCGLGALLHTGHVA